MTLMLLEPFLCICFLIFYTLMLIFRQGFANERNELRYFNLRTNICNLQKREVIINEEYVEKGSYSVQFLAGIGACILMAACGAHMAWSSPAIPYLSSNSSLFPITDEQAGWIVSLYNLGDLFGGLLNPVFIDRIGRKNTLLLFALPSLIGWTLIIFAKNYMYLYAARLIAGISQGSTFNSLVIYLTEISEKKIRGMLVNLMPISLSVGVFIFSSIAAFTSYEVLNISSASILFLFFIVFPFLPETPYYHLLRERNDAAMKCLMKLRGIASPQKLEAEMREMKLAVEKDRKNAENSVVFELISKSYNRKGLAIMFCLKMTQFFSGIVPIASFAQEIFSYSNPSIEGGIQVVILNGISICGCLVTNIFIDRFNRRKLFLSSGILTTICLGSVGLFFFIKDYSRIDVSHITWFPLAALVSFKVMYKVGVGTIPYIVQGELFSINVKGPAIAFCMTLGSMFAFVTAVAYKVLSSAAGVYTTFWLFTVSTFIGSFLTFWILPDTRGKTLEETQAMQNPEWDETLKLERSSKVLQLIHENKGLL